MPVYEYICDNGHSFEKILKVKDYQKPQKCECGANATKRISIPMLNLDIQPWDSYVSPVSGKLITSYKERRADMKAHGCEDYEPSLRHEITRNMESSDAAIEKKLDETVEATIEKMSAHKRERLANELNAGADCTYERK